MHASISDNFDRVLQDSIRKHQIAVEYLTEQQMIQVVRSMISSGDMRRVVRVSDGGQTVVYVPGEGNDILRARVDYLEKLLAIKGMSIPEDHL